MGEYLFLMAAALVLGVFMPQHGEQRKHYIILMAVMHAFLCGFRYMHLTGDLMKYHSTFDNVAAYGWFSEELLREGRNSGMYIIMKVVYHLTGGNYQVFLLLVAVCTEAALAVLIYRYSPAPWMSYLVWNSLGFYIFGFSAVKQAFAMVFIMLALIGLLEKNLKFYLAMILCAGMIHAPAFIFLPAYWLVRQKVNIWTLVGYGIFAVLVFAFKENIVSILSEFYYDEHEEMIHSGSLGNRFLMIFLIVLCGVMLKGFQEWEVEALFHLMVVSMILQMFAGFDNIFTRLTDYYFQFSVIFIPMIFYRTDGKRRLDRPVAVFRFNAPSMRVLMLVVTAVLVYFYWEYTMASGQLNYGIDDYRNYRFMWDVQ